MKPTGPIPDRYAARDGELVVAGMTAREALERAGSSPAFVYDLGLVRGTIARLRGAMPERLHLNYAVKANPYPPLVQAMAGLVDGFDIASGGELALVQDAGIDAKRVSFAGPGKRDEELRQAIRSGVTLNLESENEAARALAIGRELDIRPRLAIRVNPPFDLKGSGMKMGGGAKPFGIDADRVPALIKHLAASECEFRGLHIYAGSQSLDADAIIAAQHATLSLAGDLAQEAGVDLPAINIGGGFGVPYFAKDEPLDIDAIGSALDARVQSLAPRIASAEIHMELGRYLVAEAGVYLTTIVDRKESGGEVFLVTDGGLHHQLAASGNFGTVVRRNYPIAVATKFDAAPEEAANVVGCLCTPLDRLGDQVHLPRAEVGDIVAIFMAGAYGASASPSAFLGQGPAAEILL